MEDVLSVTSVDVDVVASLVSVVEARNDDAASSGWRSAVWTGLVAVSGMTIVGTERTARYVLRVSGVRISVKSYQKAIVRHVRARLTKDCGVFVDASCARS